MVPILWTLYHFDPRSSKRIILIHDLNFLYHFDLSIRFFFSQPTLISEFCHIGRWFVKKDKFFWGGFPPKFFFSLFIKRLNPLLIFMFIFFFQKKKILLFFKINQVFIEDFKPHWQKIYHFFFTNKFFMWQNSRTNVDCGK